MKGAGDLVHQFHVIMDALAGLPERDLENVEKLVEVGEWVIALENLCTQLHEYDVVVTEDTLTRIETLGRALGVADRYWEMLARDR